MHRVNFSDSCFSILSFVDFLHERKRKEELHLGGEALYPVGEKECHSLETGPAYFALTCVAFVTSFLPGLMSQL